VKELKVDLLAKTRARTGLATLGEPHTGDADTHHGDLRKGVYLRRRADYRLQQGLGNTHRFR
jgi:hypothetical protein